MIKYLEKLNLDSKKLSLIIIITSVLVLYLDYSFVIKLQLKGISGITPKINKLKTDIDSLNRDLKNLESIKNKQKEVQQKALSEAKKIINEEQISSLLQFISNAANKNSIRILQIRPSKEAPIKFEGSSAKQEPKFSSILINMELTGDYHKLGKFINELENYETFISVQEMSILYQPADEVNQRINLTLMTYVAK